MTVHGIGSTTVPIHYPTQTIHQTDLGVPIARQDELLEEIRILRSEILERKNDTNENNHKLCKLENSIKNLEKLVKNFIEEPTKKAESTSKQRKERFVITFPLTCDFLIRHEGLSRTLGRDNEGYVKGQQLLLEFDKPFKRKFSVHIHGYSETPSADYGKLLTYKVYV